MRRRPLYRRAAVGAGLTALVLACGSAGPAASVYPPTAFGPEGMTVQRGDPLAPALTADGRTRAGVLCRRLPPRFHIHVHLALYVDRRLRPVPATVGLAGPTAHPRETGPMYFAHTCYYDVHTHAQDGVIHVEAPAPQAFTLGNFCGGTSSASGGSRWGLAGSGRRPGR